MMISPRFACFFVAVCLASPWAATQAADLLPPSEAGRLGMVESWRRQLSTIGGSQSVVDIVLHVENERKRTFVEVTSGTGDEARVLLRIPTDQVDRFGNAIGQDEANRRARMEVLRLRERGIEATVAEKTSPQVRIYCLGEDGTIEARDAETGELFWVTRHGNPRLPTGSLGVDDQFITFTNGSKLLQISAEDGRLIQEFPLVGSPLMGSVIAGQFALVPTTRAGLEGFPLVDTDMYPFLRHTAGRSNSEPTAAPSGEVAAWGTDAGFVYVMELVGEPSFTFRFDCDGEVQTRVAAASEDRFFFGTSTGHVYGLKATRTGQVLWRRTIDQPIDDPAFVDEDRLYFSTFYNNLFCLDLVTGESKWTRPSAQVTTVLATTDDQIFVRTNTERLGVLGKATGAKASVASTTIGDQYIVNRHTDRLYLLSAGGTLQCLRPVGAEMPTVKTAVAPPPAEEKPEAEAAETPEPDEGEPMPEDDPLEEGLDPFAPADAEDDPFGDVFGGDSPF